MKYLILLFFFALAISGTAQTTSPCYPEVRANGLRLRNLGQYKQAIYQLLAARTCGDVPANNDLDKLIEQTLNVWANELNEALENARKAEREARAAENTAITAREEAVLARKKAEDNAGQARAEGQRAESLRLSLLADIARQNNNASDALMLAYLSLELAGNPAIQNAVLPSFAKAVKDSLTRSIATIPQQIKALYPSKDGQWVAAQTANDVFLCQITSDKIAVTHLPGQQWLCFAGPDGQQLAVTRAADGNEATLWRQGVPTPLRGHTEPVTAASATTDGQRLVTTSRDNTAKLWDANGRLIATFSGHAGNVYAARFSPDGQQILTRSSDGKLGLWQNNGQLIRMLGDDAGYFYQCAFSPDGKRIAGASATGLAIWDNNGNAITTFGQEKAPCLDLVFTFNQNEQSLLSRSTSNDLKLWDLKGNNSASFAHNSSVDGWTAREGQGHFMSWSQDGHIRYWSVGGALMEMYAGHSSRIIHAESGQNLVLGAAEDGLAKLWTYDGILLMDWLTTIPPALSVPNNAVIYTDESGKQLLTTPLPVEVYNTMRENQPILEARLQEIREKYAVAKF